MFRMENLKSWTAVGAGMLLLAGTFTAWSVSASDFPEPGDFQTGAKIWVDNCGRCHNIRSARELRDDQWVTSTYHMRVRAGLTGQDTRDVLTFLQGSNSPAPRGHKTTLAADSGPGAGRSGQEIYVETCVACHGPGGTGNVPGVPDLTLSSGVLTKTDEVLVRNMMNGFQSPGSPMAMPAKGGNPALNETDLRALLAYMRKAFGN